MENALTVIGNIASEPELRFTPSGAAVVNFTVAQTPRKYNQESKTWVDAGETNFYRCSAWNKLAEHIAEGFKSGDRVIVVGALNTQKYEDKDRPGKFIYSTNNLTIEDCGLSPKWDVVRSERQPKQNGGGNQGGYNQQASNGGGNQGWGGQSNVGNSRPDSNEPPF